MTDLHNFENEDDRELDEIDPEEDAFSSASETDDDSISSESDSDDDSIQQMDCNNEEEPLTPNQEDLDEKYKYAVKNVPVDDEPKYSVRSPIDRTNKAIIVWEPDRPIPTFEGIPGLGKEFSFDSLRLDESCTNEQTLRTQIVSTFRILLQYEKGTVGHPYGDENCTLWTFLENSDIGKVIRLYTNVIEALHTSNQYVVDHNITLFYCTGSHNNAVLLGASEQAKAAMFYIAPYMAKEKAPLSACLTILEKARKEVKQFPSKLEKRFIALFERQHNELLLDDDLFEEQHSFLSNRAAKVAKQVNSDAEAFSHSVTESSTHDNSYPIGWVIPHEASDNICCATESSSTWYDKCDWLYKDGDDDDGSPYRQRPNDDDDHSFSSNSSEDTPPPCVGDGCDDNAKKKTELNCEQRQVIDIYRSHLQDHVSPLPSQPPPPVVLLTGQGGTGKSFVINTLLQLGNNTNIEVPNKVWTCANNNLNAADIDGSAIASLLKQTIEPSKDGHATHHSRPQKRIPEAAIAALQTRDDTNVKLLNIDEVSNITAQKLGELSRLFQMATGITDKCFGGIPVLLVGDYNQKEPVGELATTSLLKYIENKHKLEVKQNLKKHGTDDGDITTRRKTTQRPQLKQMPKEDTMFAKSKYNSTSDHAKGCEIIANARWFELTKSELSKDELHNSFIHELYVGTKRITMERIKQYDIYNFETVTEDTLDEHAKWIRAPVIVKTNRERITINYWRAFNFARHTKTFFVRWATKYSQWEDKPPYSEMEEILEDPAFWEIFVAGAPCYLNHTICKKKRLCNGTRGQFHSLLLDEVAQAEFDAQSQAGFTIITLSTPPQGINILISEDNVTSKRDWYGLEATSQGSTTDNNKQEIIVPIQPSAFADRDKPMCIVSPNILIRPSRVKISLHFPVRGGLPSLWTKHKGKHWTVSSLLYLKESTSYPTSPLHVCMLL